MRKLNYYLAFLVVIFICVSCKNSQTVDTEELVVENIEIENGEYRQLLANNLMEDKELQILLYDVIVEHQKIENNRFVFNLDKEEFVEKGIPAEYYDFILFGIKENNDALDAGLIEEFNLEETWEEFIESWENHKIELCTYWESSKISQPFILIK